MLVMMKVMSGAYRQEIAEGYYSINVPDTADQEEVTRLVDRSLGVFRELSESVPSSDQDDNS